MGQMFLEKRCPKCQRPMSIQCKQKLDGTLYELKDFFWACVGYYHPSDQCKTTESLKPQEATLFYKYTIPELQIPNRDFNLIFNEKPVQNLVIDRITGQKGNKDQDVLCPIHHVPMVLREKNDHNHTVLDMYFLACSHYQCRQKVKLKSPAQLAAFLKRREGQGIL